MDVSWEGHSGLYTMHFSNLFPPDATVTSSPSGPTASGSSGNSLRSHAGGAPNGLGHACGGAGPLSASASSPTGALTEFSKWHLLIRMNVENDICFVKGEAKVFSPTPSLTTPAARGLRGKKNNGALGASTTTPSSSSSTSGTAAGTAAGGGGRRSPSSSSVRQPDEDVPIWQRDRRCQVLIEGTFRFCDFSDQASAFRLEVRLERLETAILGLPPGPDLENVVLSCGGHRACGWHMGVVQVTSNGKKVNISPLPLHFLLKPYFGPRCTYCLDPVYAFGYSCGVCEVTHYCSRACMQLHMSPQGGHGLLCPLLKQHYSVRSASLATEVNDVTRVVAWWRSLDDSYYTILVDDQLGPLGCAIEFTLCTLKSAKKEGLQFRFITAADKVKRWRVHGDGDQEEEDEEGSGDTKASHHHHRRRHHHHHHHSRKEKKTKKETKKKKSATTETAGRKADENEAAAAAAAEEAAANHARRRRRRRGKGRKRCTSKPTPSSSCPSASSSSSSRCSSSSAVSSCSSSADAAASSSSSSSFTSSSTTSSSALQKNGERRIMKGFLFPSNEDVIDFACLLFREVNRSAIEEGCISLSSACLSYLFLYSPATEITIQAHMLFYSGFKCEELGVPLTTIEEYVSFVRPIHSLAILQLEYALRSSIASEFWRRLRSARDAALSLCAINDSKPCFGNDEMRVLVEQQQCEAMLLLAKIYVIMSTRCSPADHVEWLKEGERLLRQCLTRRVVLMNDYHHAMYCFRLAVYLLLFRSEVKNAEAEQLRKKGEALLKKMDATELNREAERREIELPVTITVAARPPGTAVDCFATTTARMGVGDTLMVVVDENGISTGGSNEERDPRLIKGKGK